jgi:hypothetical protein
MVDSGNEKIDSKTYTVPRAAACLWYERGIAKEQVRIGAKSIPTLLGK